MARRITPLVLVVALCATGGAVVLALEPAGERAQTKARSAGPPVDRQASVETAREARRRAAAKRRGPSVRYRDSVALGVPEAGRLVRGVNLPRASRHHFTWDPVRRVSPSPRWRRWGTAELVRGVLRVIGQYARAHPRAPRIGVGDLSRPHGGDFGALASGGIGHATHQNGLDVDIYYPIESGAERSPLGVEEVRMRLAQDLVDRFVAAGAETVYVGPNTPLTGPRGVVVPAANHDNHLHVRIPNPD